MNTRILAITSALLALTAIPAWAAEGVDISQLPAPVKGALTAAGISVPVKEVTIRSIGGRTVFDFEFERRGAANPRLRVAADGTVLRDSRQPEGDEQYARAVAAASEFGTSLYIPKVRFEDLPASVQQTIEKEAVGREIAGITSDKVDGRKVYLVEFKERGRNPRLFVGDDGTVLQPEEKAPVSFFGITFAAAPQPVQETIRREAGDQQIVRIDKRGLGAKPNIYSVEIKGDGGVFELRIAEDGRIVSDSRGDSHRSSVR